MRRFRLQLMIRMAMLGGTMWITVYLFAQTTSYVAGGIMAAVVLSQLVSLFTYVEKTNRDVGRFLRSIRYNDFSQTFASEGRGSSFEELRSAFTEVMDDFRAARSEKEEHYRYMLTVMQHIGIGLVSFKQNGEVGLINNAAKRLLRVRNLKSIKELSEYSRKLAGTLLQMQPGEKALVQVIDNDELLQLSIYATAFRLRDEYYTLVSIHNIQNELEEKEIEAWQKLTRVLTHEIMNSITPIASLASTANELLVEAIPEVMPGGDGAEVDENYADIQSALRTIERRSDSLLHFVNAYRSLTRIPKPDFAIFNIGELFRDIEGLMRRDIEASGTRFIVEVQPPQLDVTADLKLVEQVLINLVKNAKEAVHGVPEAEVRLTARIDERGRTIMQVTDNGPGIIREAMDKIFIPFFTTKPEGSGIGLALSRQIMRQHGGNISVVSEPDRQTTFTLRF